MQKMPIRKTISLDKIKATVVTSKSKLILNLAPGGGTVISFVAIQ
jgi:hypothetical protein